MKLSFKKSSNSTMAALLCFLNHQMEILARNVTKIVLNESKYWCVLLVIWLACLACSVCIAPLSQFLSTVYPIILA